jgi:hypothetical protein
MYSLEMNKELMNLLVPAVLFVLLVPGVLVTLPSEANTRVEQALTHAAVFIVAYGVLRQVFAQFY